jgi:hypothetical protein
MENTQAVKAQEDCSHEWIPAGSRKNKDRVHNCGSGKYKAYKCSKCNKFKRRYF